MLNMVAKLWNKRRLKNTRKTVQSARMQNSECWNSLKVPAVLFFEVIETNNIELLTIKGKPTIKQLIDSWEQIYDLYFQKKNDTKLKLILKTRAEIHEAEFRIKTIKNVVNVFRTLPLTKDQQQRLINKLNEINVYIDSNKGLLNELHRLATVFIPQLETRLEIDRMNLDELTKGKKTDFNDACVSIENILERTIEENVSLAKYLSLEKAADKKVKKLEKMNAK